MLFKRKKKKLIPPLKRTRDEVPFQVYEIQEKKKDKPVAAKRENRFVSPIFGRYVKDEVVIPIRSKVSRDMDNLDAFRTKPRMTKDERIRKYGTAYPEFDLVRGKNLDEVVESQNQSHSRRSKKIVGASIIDNDNTQKEDREPTHNNHEETQDHSTPDMPHETQTSHSEATAVKRDTSMYNYLRNQNTPEEESTEEATTQEEPPPSPPSKSAVEQEKPQDTPSQPTQESTSQPAAKPAEKQHAMPTYDRTKQTVKAGDSLFPSYQIPQVSLLKEPSDDKPDLSESIERQINRLNELFSEFSVGARVFKHTEGPTVTRYELALEKGVKVNKITTLVDNIKMALEAKDIRIEAPIPGKKTVGIEVPNEQAQTVHFANIVKRSMFKNAAMPLTIALGLDIDGNPIYAPIKSMPHGLIAGATGSGKSVCINTILMSLLLKYKPSELKLMLIDPKMVELSAYNHLPHLITPVITDAKASAAALNWVVEEMERRFKTFSENNARDIDSYNRKTEDESEKLPYIVIIVDELADLMMVASQNVEESIMRITQKARACGIHLIVATQRPSTDVIKGTIKSNIPTRIAFSVSSHIDSQTIIDSAGAETLLGKGDMLYAPSGQSKQRLQGAFVNDVDIETVTEFIRNQAEPNYLFNEEALVKNATKTFEQDELLEDVARYVVDAQEASINKISKNFSIGFNRAQRIVESLEAAGIVSANLGSKAREVLVDDDDIEHILNNMG